MFEIEQKYRIKNPTKYRAILNRLKWIQVASGVEKNQLFDLPNRLLRDHKSVLRLRSYKGKTVLTYKGPRLKGILKKRIEIETESGSYAQTRKILMVLGYRPFFTYSKTREVYESKQSQIVLDHFKKLGWFLEIEGSPKVISYMARQLKLTSSDIEPLSYPQLLQNRMQIE